MEISSDLCDYARRFSVGVSQIWEALILGVPTALAPEDRRMAVAGMRLMGPVVLKLVLQ
ncbi:MAG: hypothetical protein MK171_03080 [Pirellulales bacterium]|nr:hypothetical protein [Pirellulales bacterium]